MTEILEKVKGLLENWDVKSIAEEIENMYDREAMIELVSVLPSLITTIESQKEEIERLQKPALSLAYRVLKQKYEEDAESYIEHIFKIESEIESLKAITELAVKGLKKVCYFAPTGTESFDAADTTLSEIERLQNAQT